MKRVTSAVLVCLLLCGLVTTTALADDAIDVSGARPLALGVAATFAAEDVFSYTPPETGWVKFRVDGNTLGLTLFYAPENEPVRTIFRAGYPNAVDEPSVKIPAGKTLYFHFSSATPGWNNTITLTPSQTPVLRQNELKLWTNSSGSNTFEPFQQAYIGAKFTVNGDAAPAHGFDYASSMKISVGSDTAAGTYTLQFMSQDSEDLGTLTVILEDWSLRASLANFLEKMQINWANDDKTTKDWLKSIGNGILLLLASPIVALMMLTMGPVGFVLIPVAFAPLVQLPIDIIGLIKSFFR